MRWAILLWMLLAAPLGAAEIDLSHTSKFMFGDDAAYADPAFDDADWPEAPLAARADWAALGAAPADDVKWERIRFITPSAEDFRNPAVQIGVFNGADEVWLSRE